MKNTYKNKNVAGDEIGTHGHAVLLQTKQSLLDTGAHTRTSSRVNSLANIG